MVSSALSARHAAVSEYYAVDAIGVNMATIYGYNWPYTAEAVVGRFRDAPHPPPNVLWGLGRLHHSVAYYHRDHR
jgi:hypothetical protein